MGEIVYAPFVTSLDMDVGRVLDGARDEGMAEIVIVGETTKGEDFFASNLASGVDVIFHLTRGIHKMNKIIDRIERGEIEGKRLTVPEGPKGDILAGPWRGDCEDGGGI